MSTPGFVERLESRQFLSIASVGMEEPDCSAAEAAELRVLRGNAVRLPQIKGSYVGTSKTRFGTVTIVLTIKKQKPNGNWSGTVTGPDLSFTISGKVDAKRQFTFRFTGRDEEGRAVGSGTAKLSKRGGKVTGSFRETEGRVTYRGTLALQKVQY